MTHNDIDILAVRKWGNQQLLMLIEEMGELTQAIIKRERGLPHNISEEVADVEIVLSQIKFLLDIGDEVYTWKNYKYERLKNKLLAIKEENGDDFDE